MRIKFEAVDKNGKLHKRASVNRFYRVCTKGTEKAQIEPVSFVYPSNRYWSLNEITRRHGHERGQAREAITPSQPR